MYVMGTSPYGPFEFKGTISPSQKYYVKIEILFSDCYLLKENCYVLKCDTLIFVISNLVRVLFQSNRYLILTIKIKIL